MSRSSITVSGPARRGRMPSAGRSTLAVAVAFGATALLAACTSSDLTRATGGTEASPTAVRASSSNSAPRNEWRSADDARTTASGRPVGTIIAAPENLTAFRPRDTMTSAIDSGAVSFRRVLEDLGPDATLWYQHVQTLANPFFEGRVNGSAGTERTRDYMEFYFKLYGLEPAFPEVEGSARTSYRQPFEFSAGRGMRTVIENAHASFDGRDFVETDDFVVLGSSASGSVSAPLTFVGYGIDSGPDGYSSFDDGADLSGRVALLLRYEPLDDDGGSRWAERRFSPQAGLAGKMRSVATRGAEGIILVNPPGARDGADGLERSGGRNFGRQLDIPVIQMTPEAADDLVRATDPEGRGLLEWRRAADAGRVTTADLDDEVMVAFGADVSVERNQRMLPAENMGAVLPGRGALADEWVIVGGHYDHNGYGQFGTDPSDGPLFPGADDNASGTAGMLILAKSLSTTYAEMDADADLRSVIFIGFDAEERGLHGSRHFASNPPVPVEDMQILLNMDMIGRLRSDSLSAIGVGTAEGLEEVLRPHFEASGLTVAVSAAGSGRSDDANFHRVEVPAIHFFTGMHEEYTTPQDHAWTVNPGGAGKILDLLYDIAVDMATRPEQLVYAVPGRSAGEDRGYARVRLGIRPAMDQGDLDTGIKIEDVSEGTSAEDAGIRGGDVMLTWNGAELDELRSLFELLQNHKPGDVVKVRILRDGREQEIDITLKAAEPG